LAKSKSKVVKQKFRSTQRFQKSDPRFNSMVVTKFINRLMWDGKKAIASGIVYDAMDILEKKVTDVEPLEIFLGAIQNVMPQVEVRSRRVGGATYQVPVEVNRRRAQALAIRTIVETCRGRSGKPMAERLSDELAQAYRKEGASVTWRENTHKMAEANKLFAHYAW
jgi:small subunit ribosomal protein S7